MSSLHDFNLYYVEDAILILESLPVVEEIERRRRHVFIFELLSSFFHLRQLLNRRACFCKVSIIDWLFRSQIQFLLFSRRLYSADTKAFLGQRKYYSLLKSCNKVFFDFGQWVQNFFDRLGNVFCWGCWQCLSRLTSFPVQQ